MSGHSYEDTLLNQLYHNTLYSRLLLSRSKITLSCSSACLSFRTPDLSPEEKLCLAQCSAKTQMHNTLYSEYYKRVLDQ